MMRNLLIEPQTREPSPCQVHAQFFHQLTLARNAVQIADQQNAQQQLRINRRPALSRCSYPSIAAVQTRS